MPDYVSKFTGIEIDDAIQKSKDINKNASQINNSFTFTDKIKTELDSTNSRELIYKNANGELSGSGIVDEDNKIFFPKDGRFPSASIEVGPAMTLSESGGWLMNTSHASGTEYIVLDYEINSNGSKRPTYWERAQQEEIIIQSNSNVVMNNFTTYNFTPTENAQINQIYYNFVNPVTNLRLRYTSNLTGEVVKYIPNEASWRNGTGINVLEGIQPVLLNTTSFSELNTYSIKVEMVADDPISLRGNGTLPYIKLDRQLITPKSVLLQGEGTGSPDTPEQIRDKLSVLTGGNRLDASAIKNIPSSGGSDTALQIKDKLETLTGEDRLNATAIKGIEGIFSNIDGGTATTSFNNTIEGGNASGY